VGGMIKRELAFSQEQHGKVVSGPTRKARILAKAATFQFRNRRKTAGTDSRAEAGAHFFPHASLLYFRWSCAGSQPRCGPGCLPARSDGETQPQTFSEQPCR